MITDVGPVLIIKEPNFRWAFFLNKMQGPLVMLFFCSALCALLWKGHRVAFILATIGIVVLWGLISEQLSILLVDFWVSDLGQKYGAFPVTEEERAALRPWALGELKKFAERATTTIYLREAQAKLLASIRRPSISVTGVLTPDDLVRIRGENAKLQKEYETRFHGATRAFERCKKEAEHAHKQYLKVWDFFTKPILQGLAILDVGEGPEAFRELVAAEKGLIESMIFRVLQDNGPITDRALLDKINDFQKGWSGAQFNEESIRSVISAMCAISKIDLTSDRLLKVHSD